MAEIEETRQMVEPPEIHVERELNTDDDGKARQPVEDTPEPDDEGD